MIDLAESVAGSKGGVPSVSVNGKEELALGSCDYVLVEVQRMSAFVVDGGLHPRIMDPAREIDGQFHN